MDKPMSDLEKILRALYESEINVSISWVRDNGIDVELGDPLNGYDASDKVSTFSEATAWLRDQACKHYPDSEFARKYGGFVWIRAPASAQDDQSQDGRKGRAAGHREQREAR